MRLTCPNCGATYALGAEAIPQGGGHVQCGACHTRWFIRPERPAAVALSEDQIVARLENRVARAPSPSGGEAPVAAAARSAPIAFPGPMRPIQGAGGAERTSAPDVATAQAAPAAPVAAPVTSTPLRPRQPAERPAPAPAPAVGAAPAAAPPRSAAPMIGFAVAIGLAALGLATYLRADWVTTEAAPPADRAAAAYVAAVDAARGWIEARLGPARDSLFPD